MISNTFENQFAITHILDSDYQSVHLLGNNSYPLKYVIVLYLFDILFRALYVDIICQIGNPPQCVFVL
jgi:hypothetical protein